MSPNPKLHAQDSASPVINGVRNALATLDGTTATTYIKTIKQTVGDDTNATGNSNFSGGGTWLGDEYSGSGEYKPELVVTPDGKAHLAGTSGWEFENLPAGTKIFNNSQTKRMLGGRYAKGNMQGTRFEKGTGKYTTGEIIVWATAGVSDASAKQTSNASSIA